MEAFLASAMAVSGLAVLVLLAILHVSLARRVRTLEKINKHHINAIEALAEVVGVGRKDSAQ